MMNGSIPPLTYSVDVVALQLFGKVFQCCPITFQLRQNLCHPNTPPRCSFPLHRWNVQSCLVQTNHNRLTHHNWKLLVTMFPSDSLCDLNCHLGSARTCDHPNACGNQWKDLSNHHSYMSSLLSLGKRWSVQCLPPWTMSWETLF